MVNDVWFVLLETHLIAWFNTRVMLHQSGLEAAYVTTYVEDYLDAMDALPSQVQPHLSEVCRLDIECRGNVFNCYH